ncbi:hypothetical protein F0U61_41595 [Archangium violaceum]|uniref:hypothetical protein n=1 Tax=Archangium violaceum TaxID=83451 RepID=UPI002B2AD1DC|nr:hypothetical protein F0U61_41595 [Archangium violaceum]
MNAVEIVRVLCVILFAAVALLSVIQRRRWHAWLRDIEPVLAKHRVTLSDDGKYHWVATSDAAPDIVVEGYDELALPPGADSEKIESKASTRLKMPLPGGGLLMIPPDIVEKLLGPMPPVPRVRTEDARFDEALATFAQNGTLPQWPGGEVFPSPTDRAFLLAHRLRWLRWNDDQFEAAFEPRMPGEAVPLLAFALALRKRQSGRGVPTPVPDEVSLPPQPAAINRNTIGVIVIAAFFLAFFSWLAPATIGPLNDVVSQHVCGVEGLQYHSEGVQCPNGRDVTEAALAAGASIGLLLVLSVRFLTSLLRSLHPEERPVA